MCIELTAIGFRRLIARSAEFPNPEVEAPDPATLVGKSKGRRVTESR
jgi:hypothetical protein